MAIIDFNGFLQGLEKDGRTGTLVSVCEDNTLGRIYFVDGRVVSARCRNLHGIDALKKIREKSLASAKFHTNIDLVRSQSTIDIDLADISTFATSANADDTPDSFETGVDTSEFAPGQSSGKSMSVSLTPALRSIISDELSEYLGPVASMIMEDLDDGISLKNALNTLAQEFDDTDTAVSFIEAVKNRI